ncbi:MAG: hypothetical protein KGI04_03240 [Candidatus Micrarchaeota archaeon]|nr:hypothetical protein [Candidatus Micrarchaeota archaeon]
MDIGFTASMLSLIAIAVLYAAFDLFNKRNVPDVFAYASVLVGLAVTLLFYQNELLLSLTVALIVGSLGYVVYRMGLWGAGDYFELVAISLVFPVQPAPMFSAAVQLGLPFILSVFVATGFAAIWVVPIYYLLFVKKMWSRVPDLKHVAYGASLFTLYMVLLFFVYYFYGFGAGRVALILLVAIPSSLTLVFEEEITTRMVERIYPRRLDEGDIIAFNMMSASERRYFSKYSGFGRLATKQLIARIRNAKITLPVYRNAAPLAVFILIGVVVSLFFGNVVLFIV